ncbi:hypothetical protein [Arthrobacter mobilis]|uniref:Uncharacterized protein n=1 Tax=Arthrobacter mobilis TaxID=2724944 RepID=A0A7X6K755_9MICC|nr:hypothetical protein [Arthrobacter mobilis]NKX56376.1 hypothetical protein [Arthrobacter mobilis]
MTEVNDGDTSAEESYPPLNPDPVDQRESPEWGQAGNIRDKQQTHAGGAVPPAYIGSGDPDAGTRPEDAVDDSEQWDQHGR